MQKTTNNGKELLSLTKLTNVKYATNKQQNNINK